MNVILFGFKGCGKTYFGNLLAQQLICPFVDTDDLVVKLYQEKTNQLLAPSAIYQQIGEIPFRMLETEAIVNLKNFQNGIIALGGGSILNPLNRQLLSSLGRLIYLETSLETLQARGITHIAGGIEILYKERLSLYRAIEAPCIQTDLLNDKEVIAAICAIREQTYAF